MNEPTTLDRLSSDALWERLAPEFTPSQERAALLYVHVPFCSTKCAFCDWVKEIPATRLRAGRDVRGRYVESVARQIRHHAPRIEASGHIARLIYWGGGTPSYLEADEIRVLGRALREAFERRDIEEFTVECSPETLTDAKLEALREEGVTRLSIGAQSFDDDELRRSGRAHSAHQIVESVERARAAGFDDFNLDLIAGFPGQPTERLADAVRRTVALAPAHVTVYVYRATEGTTMAEQLRRGARQPTEYEVMFDSYTAAREILEASGYREYAIGYFARDTRRPCRADQYYFSIEGDYFGFGAGAHSILGHHFFENAAARQDTFVDDPCGFSHCERFTLGNLGRLFTSLSQALWIPEGVSCERFERLYGLSFDEVLEQPAVRAFMRYYELCGARFERTPTYLRVSQETMVPAYIRALSLYGTQNQGRSATRGREPAAETR
jgi:oxygen-independent coproporphyrinogen-3 oxidase